MKRTRHAGHARKAQEQPGAAAALDDAALTAARAMALTNQAGEPAARTCPATPARPPALILMRQARTAAALTMQTGTEEARLINQPGSATIVPV